MTGRIARAVVFGVLLMALLAASGCTSSKQVGLLWADRGKPVTVDAGGTVTVSLESNPSTGYTWDVKSAGPLQLKGEPTFEAGGEAKAVGAAGVQIFTFDAPKAGTGTLTLTYQRPWESKQPEKTWSVDVTVK